MEDGNNRKFTALKKNDEGQLKKYQKPEHVFTDVFNDPNTGKAREGSEWSDQGTSDNIHRKQLRHRSGSVSEFHFHTDTEKPGGIYHTTRNNDQTRVRFKTKSDPSQTGIGSLQNNIFKSK